MSRETIQHVTGILQDAREGSITMHGIAFTRLIHRIIREYGRYRDNSFSVDVNNLDTADRKLVVSYYESPECCEWAYESLERINALFGEYSTHFQKLVAMRCDEVYREDMEERGMYSWQHRDNGETSWVRR